MADQDEAAGYAQEGLSLTETVQTLNSSFKDDLGTAKGILDGMPSKIGTIMNSLEHTLARRAVHLSEISENAMEKVRAADQTERFDETSNALARLDKSKDINTETAAALDEAKSHAKRAHEALKELNGRILAAYYGCDSTDVEILAARNDIEELIRRFS